MAKYQVVAASQTDKVLGAGGGAKGDTLDRIILVIQAALTGTVSIKDGSGAAIPLTVSTIAIGVYTIPLGIESVNGPWTVTTGGGAQAICIGNFS